MRRIEIYRDGVLAATGHLDSDGEIVDCSAILGSDQDASDATYEAINDAIDATPQDAERYTESGTITRPDGTYTWTIG